MGAGTVHLLTPPWFIRMCHFVTFSGKTTLISEDTNLILALWMIAFMVFFHRICDHDDIQVKRIRANWEECFYVQKHFTCTGGSLELT